MGARRLLLGATVLLLWLKVAAAGAADGPSPFLLDPAADFWTIDEAIERLADRPAFQPAPGDRFVQPLKPFTDRTVWFQIALPPTTRRVAILDGAMRAADLYFVAENRVLRRYRSGLLQPLATRADDHPGFNFTVPRSEQPMRLLVHSRMPYSSGPTPLLLLTEPEFVSYMRLKHMQHGMFFGIALLVALFTLAVALGMQRLEHLSFGAYCLGAAALTASFDGFLSYYLLPESPLLAMRALPIATLVMLVAQLQFGVQLLEVRSWNPGLHRASRLLLLPCIVLPLVTAIYPASLLYPLLSWIGVAVLLALGLMVLLGARAQAPFARLYALSLLPTALALGAVLTNTQTAGGFPSFAGAVILGTIGQIILLAGQRTRYLRESRNAEQANQDRQQELLAQLRTLTASTVDLTETQSLQRSLQQQQRLRTVGKIAAGVAHDFNNILTSISGFAELLQVDRGRFSVAKRDHFLAQIRAATERGASLVRQLNVYSRESRPRSAGRSIIEPIERTLRLLRSSVNPGIHFDTRIEVQDAQSRIDPEQLEQVISNIALNAVEAMDGEGRITVELLHLTDLDLTCTSCLRPVRGRMLCLRITDDGPGISGHPEDLFTPFATGTNDGSRSGLGLSVVHGIVHQHGGHLTLRNHPERGCEVSILLPPVTYLSELTLPAVNRILLIRPDPALALEHFEALEGEYDLEAVSSTSAALEYFIEHQQVIRLVVIDSALQLKRWLDLADDMRRLQPRLPLLIFNDALDRDTRSQVETLTAQDGRLQVVNPKASDFSPLAAVHRMLEPTTAESLRVDPLLDSWRSSR